MENQSVTIEENIVKFKSLAISNIVHLDLIKTTLIFNFTFWILSKRTLFGKGKKTKIKHSNLCNSCKNGGLKEVNIFG